jgi:hypothetical protein
MTVNILRLSCDLCGVEKERELIPDVAPSDKWICVSVVNGKDKRKKRDCAICPSCFTVVAACAGVSIPAPSTEPCSAPKTL